jgi:hypothetical protein
MAPTRLLTSIMRTSRIGPLAEYCIRVWPRSRFDRFRRRIRAISVRGGPRLRPAAGLAMGLALEWGSPVLPFAGIAKGTPQGLGECAS